ncbi:hypothetical protein DH2020_044857 [Rehmannia glutinosa]|uniref:NAD-dependent epimerase/dehydratase domain-containing protein n=1 Tax=Rehmannia glutinosa TaxID=99300 RepID=A0ABR0UFQ3_REHGL
MVVTFSNAGNLFAFGNPSVESPVSRYLTETSDGLAASNGGGIEDETATEAEKKIGEAVGSGRWDLAVGDLGYWRNLMNSRRRWRRLNVWWRRMRRRLRRRGGIVRGWIFRFWIDRVVAIRGSGYLGSWLIKKLLLKGYTVHATLRNLGEESKTSLLKSLPNAGTRLELFQADIYNPQEFEPAIEGCQYVLHVATPLLHTQNSKYKDTTEAAIAGVRSIAESCLGSKTVKRLVYTSSVTAASSLREDGFGYKPQMDELCWTPLNLSYTYNNDYILEYTKSKTLSEKEILEYNINGKLEVVSLVCGLVGGETLLSYVPSSVKSVLSQLKGGDQFPLTALNYLQELFGSVPLVHIEDVCDAHIFCIEKTAIRGRFLCAAESCTIEEMANLYQEIHPEFQIAEGSKSGPDGRCKCDLSKLRKEGYEFKYGLKEILNDSVECGKRLGFL